MASDWICRNDDGSLRCTRAGRRRFRKIRRQHQEVTYCCPGRYRRRGGHALEGVDVASGEATVVLSVVGVRSVRPVRRGGRGAPRRLIERCVPVGMIREDLRTGAVAPLVRQDWQVCNVGGDQDEQHQAGDGQHCARPADLAGSARRSAVSFEGVA